MTSKIQKKRGYLLPSPIDGYPLHCVQILIPDAPEYRRAFVGAIDELTRWWNWEKNGQKDDRRATRAAKYWRTILEPQLLDTGFFGGCDDCPDCPSPCTVIPLDDPRIEWLPNDPFRTPDLVPDGYLFPPWYIAPALNLVGFTQGDIGTDFARITSIAGWATQYEVPRFRLTVQGAGVVRIQFVNVLQGGLALVQVDADLLQLQYVDTNKDQISVPPESASQNGIEIKLYADTEHIIDVQMFPRVDDAVIPVGFGGGIRKIELCGFDQPCVECPVTIFRLPDDCIMEYSNDDGETWTDVDGWAVNAAACFTGPQGPAGADGQDGQDCDCNLPPDEDTGGVDIPPGTDGDDKKCRVATKVTESLLDNYFVPLITDYVTDVLNGSISIQEFLQSLLTGSLSYSGNAITSLIQLLTIVEVGDDAVVVSQAGNPTNRNEIICELYCLLGDNADITASVLDQWQAAIRANTVLPTFLKERFADWLDSFGLAGIRTEAVIAMTTTDPVDCVNCDCSLCEEIEHHYDFIDPVTEGYTILSGTQEAGYISGVQIPSGGFPDYDIPGVAATSSRGAYVILHLDALVARVSVTFNFRRFTGASSGVGKLLYCYDAGNNMLFGGPLGGSLTAAQDTVITQNIDITAGPTCIHHAVLVINFGSSDINVQHIHMLEAHSYPEIIP